MAPSWTENRTTIFYSTHAHALMSLVEPADNFLIEKNFVVSPDRFAASCCVNYSAANVAVENSSFPFPKKDYVDSSTAVSRIASVETVVQVPYSWTSVQPDRVHADRFDCAVFHFRSQND